MKTQKLVCILTTAALLSGAFCAAPVLPDGTALFTAPLVAEAKEITSGAVTKLVYTVPGTGNKLYFWQDPADKHLEVWGSKLKEADTEIQIPNTFKVDGVNRPVKAIRYHAFDGQTNLRRITNTTGAITEIGEGAFLGCTNLEDVTFTDNIKSCVKKVGVCAFQGCTALHDAYFLNNVEEIGNHAFWGCTGLSYNHGCSSTLELPKLRKLGTAAFYNCSGLKSVDLSRTSLKRIPDFAFCLCSGIKSVHLPETVTEIDTHAFNECDSLTTIYIPDSVTAIGVGAFLSCDSLKNVLMSENIGSIGNSAFYDCPQMKFFVSKIMYPHIGSYSVGWHQENGQPVRNEGFVVWGKSGSAAKDYANANGFTFRTLGEAAALASANYINYEWCEENSSNQWYQKGMRYFNAAHLPYANGEENTSGGICFGMAAVSALTSSGYLSVSDYAPGYNRLRDITSIPKNTASYVTTVWANQDPLQYDYALDSSTYNFGKEMLRYAEYITYGADAAVVDISGSSPAHSMVCFGMEFKADAADRNQARWNGYDARIMLYDVNASQHYTSCYVYVKFSDGSWRWGNPFTGYSSGNTSNIMFRMTHSPEKMVDTYYCYNMDADQFFAAIRN